MTQSNDKGSKGYLFSIVLVAVIGGLLFGYDTAVISGAEKGLQAFFMGAKDFVYTDFLHGITSSSALLGCIIGAGVSGMCASRMGRKKSLIMAGVFFFLSALGSFNPEFLFFPKGEPTFSLLIAFNLYRVLGGVGVGLASAICPMYIAEVAPSNLRGTLVSWNQFAIIFGQLVVYFVNFLILGDHIAPVIQKMAEGINQIMNPGEAEWMISTGWRYMFVSEAVPAGLFTVLLFLVPETPRYLAMTGKDEQALDILAKINGRGKAQEILADIKATVTEKTEKLFTYGWLVIFVGIMLSVFQQAVGIGTDGNLEPRSQNEVVQQLETLREELDDMIGEKCEMADGIWVDAGDDDNTGLSDGTIIDSFYSVNFGKSHTQAQSDYGVDTWGKCIRNSVKARCDAENKRTGNNGYATYDASTGQCNLTIEYYKYQCEQVLGIWTDDNNCYIEK